MKKLHKLIIGTYLGPFVLTFFIVLFLLVMQFLWKYIDEFVGKGLEWYILAELLFYASANLVPLALPLAILLASIMTFGNLGEHYELVALKSSGLSLQRIMFPLIVLIVITSGSAFYFSNNIWPLANLKFASLLYDIRQKKPAIDIAPGVYYKDIDGFVIRTANKSKDGKDLFDITIYNHTDGTGNRQVTRAERGQMSMSEDEQYLIVTLFNGRSYEERPGKSHPHFKTEFEKEEIRFDLSQFKLDRTDEDLFKNNYQMLTMAQLEKAIDSLNIKYQERTFDYGNLIETKISYMRDSLDPDSALTLSLGSNNGAVSTVNDEHFKQAKDKYLDYFQTDDQRTIVQAAINLARANRTYTNSMYTELKSRRKSINRHKIEWHRKLTLSIACIVLFFIGAPLGAIIRKGGLGMPVVISVLFFLVFHISSITGEKLIKENEVFAWQGMWLATFVLSPIGIFLTYKATTDSVIMDSATYTEFFKKIGRFFVRLFKKKPGEVA